jgi:hypothetical protein
MHVPIRESTFSLPSVHLIAHLERTGGSPTHRGRETLVFSLFLILIYSLVYFAVTAPITLLSLSWVVFHDQNDTYSEGRHTCLCLNVNMEVCFQIGPHSSVLEQAAGPGISPDLSPLTMMKHHQGSLPPSICLSVHPFVHPSIHLVLCKGRGLCVSTTLEWQATKEGIHININTATAKPLDWAIKL